MSRLLLISMVIATTMGARQSCECHCSTVRISDVVLCGDLDRVSLKPKDVRSIFPPDHPKIYCVISYKFAPSNTMVEAIWRFLGGPKGSFPATELNKTSKEIKKQGRLAFSLKKPLSHKNWPVGKYELEIKLNGKSIKKLTFEVKP